MQAKFRAKCDLLLRENHCAQFVDFVSCESNFNGVYSNTLRNRVMQYFPTFLGNGPLPIDHNTSHGPQ